jgi:hypothetical protein
MDGFEKVGLTTANPSLRVPQVHILGFGVIVQVAEDAADELWRKRHFGKTCGWQCSDRAGGIFYW